MGIREDIETLLPKVREEKDQDDRRAEAERIANKLREARKAEEDARIIARAKALGEDVIALLEDSGVTKETFQATFDLGEGAVDYRDIAVGWHFLRETEERADEGHISTDYVLTTKGLVGQRPAENRHSLLYYPKDPAILLSRLESPEFHQDMAHLIVHGSFNTRTV